MSKHQEQSKAILDGLRAKLMEQVSEKQQEIEKLIQEKEELEGERDRANTNVSELKSDIDWIAK